MAAKLLRFESDRRAEHMKSYRFCKELGSLALATSLEHQCISRLSVETGSRDVQPVLMTSTRGDISLVRDSGDMISGADRNCDHFD